MELQEKRNKEGDTRMFSKRQEAILRYLSENRFSRIEWMAELFHVSAETIRRDLMELERDSSIKRVRGGAVYSSLRAQEMEYEKRMETNQPEKRAIARLACEYIQEGDAIVMNNGTSNLALAGLLRESSKSLTIVTNSPQIAIVLNENKNHSVYLTAGYLRKHNKSLVGSICGECLNYFKVDKTILNIDGISIEDGVTEYNTEEAAVIRKMLKIGRTRMVLCESGKFNEVAFNKICSLEEIDYVFTDWNLSPREIKAWKGLSVKILVARQAVE